jgi:adenosylmethionine-8-amino-7-oxononanoate aminotransferase
LTDRIGQIVIAFITRIKIAGIPLISESSSVLHSWCVQAVARFVTAARERGISFAVRGNLIILAPPLVIGENELDRALEILNALLGELDWT